MQYEKNMKTFMSGEHPNCDHPHVEKEHHLAMPTGDYACTTCGESWNKDDSDRPRR